MSATRERTAAERLPLTPAVLLLCGLGTFGVAQSPSFPDAFAKAFLIAAGLRLLFGASGRPLLPQRLLLGLGYTVSALALGYLFQRLGEGGPDALWALMCVTSVFQALALLWRQTIFTSFLLILFSSVHAAGIAFAHKDELGLVSIAVYIALLVWALLLFERRAALERETGGDGAVRHLRAHAERPLPWRSTVLTVTSLLVFGLPLGTALYLAAPRLDLGIHLKRDRAARDGDAPAGGEAGGANLFPIHLTPEMAFTGPGDGRGAPLGSVAKIKRNIEPWFEVRLLKGDTLPPTVILRDNVRDEYDPRGVWRDTISRGARPHIHRDINDGRRDGWIPLGHDNDPRRSVTLQIELLRGGQKRLYLQPDEVGLEIRRDGKLLMGMLVTESRQKDFEAVTPLLPGDVVVQRYLPQETDDGQLVNRASNSRVVPLLSYLQVPDICRAPLRAEADKVVGRESDPWKRARKLEEWLKSDAFTYTLKIPPLDPRDPVTDFVLRTKSANCEAFAYALTLMLRTLGHPARYVRGFWGGDLQEQRKSVILRGLHYHAWTEMYLDGVGWVPLNPTPPERVAADAGTMTAAAGEATTGDGEEPFSFLGYDGAQWNRFWRGLGKRVDQWLLTPVASLFSSRTGYVGIPLLLLLMWALQRRRRTMRLMRLVVAPGRKLPAGPYGQALLLLARKGVYRRSTQTGREFFRFLVRRLPAASGSMRKLTLLHELQRYAGRSSPAAKAAGGQALTDLRSALQRRPRS